MKTAMRGKSFWLGLSALALASSLQAAPVIFSDAGPTPADIADTVEAFKVQISQTGPTAQDNGVGGGPFSVGFRAVNWDLVPTANATPNLMPGDFFNTTAPVGAVMSTTGNGFRVSAKTGEGRPLRFGDIQPSYETTFQSYGGERIMAPNLGTQTDVIFFVPGDNTTPAFVRGFGVVFADVDKSPLSSLQVWDINGKSLGTFFATPSDNGLSFLGVWFNGPEQIGKVRINSGSPPLMSGVNDGDWGGLADVVALGPFFFSEPLAIPEPGTVALLSLGFLGLLWRRR
jgi:hypothetical protein